MKGRITTVILLCAMSASLVLLGQPTSVTAQTVQTVPVYRFYAHRHYYSTNLEPKENYHTEGISFYISPVELSYTIPLYALENLALWDHLYTPDIAERDAVMKKGYGLMGVLGYVLPVNLDLPGTSPLHRWRGPYDHLYAATKPDVPGYTYEGEAARIWTEPVKLPKRLVELTAPAAGASMAVNSNPVIRWNIWSNGGAIRLTYSINNGASWRPIATVANNGVPGQMNDQSFNGWKVPPEAAGKITLKADWVRGGMFGSQLPWATDTTGSIYVTGKPDNRAPMRVHKS